MRRRAQNPRDEYFKAYLQALFQYACQGLRLTPSSKQEIRHLSSTRGAEEATHVEKQ